MNIPPITKSQKQIIFLLASFRFLTISHLQQFLSHKNSHRIQQWLIDLQDKKLIAIIKDPKDKTKPYIICLDQKASHVLKTDKTVDENFLKRLYKEKQSSKEFIERLLFIASCSTYFLKNKEQTTEIHFFTQQDLIGYDYFLDPLPDAYIDQKNENQSTRYFLDVIEKGTAAGRVRFRIRQYLEYANSGEWEENTNNAPFPALLFIFESDRMKKHIYHYTKARLEKSLETGTEFFLTTREEIERKGNTDIWQKII